jgi:murein DD-endopeptidase MepM/ murein hydrolase activator NlpD
LSNPTPNSSPGVRGSSGYATDSGLDILGKTGDQIVAPASGTLQYAETGHTSWKDDSNPGKSGHQPQHSFLIELSKPFKYEGKTIKYSYGTHLSSLSSSVQNKSGIPIKAGEPIGAMGVANKVPHLHLGLLQDRAQRSESDWLSNVQVKNALLTNKGGGKGNGGPVKKHKASEFILGGGRTLTSDMGMRNFALSPGMHMGIDVSGKTGEPLQAFSDGVVEGTGYEAKGYGNWVSWIDDKGIGHFYAHMNKPAFVRKGQKIKKGTILGELGSTGRSSGPHLHWEAATKPGDTGQSKSAVLSRFNPLSKYGIDAPFGGTIRPDPSMASSPSARSPGTSSSPGAPGAPGAPQESVDYSFLDPNFTIAGADVDEKYLQSLKSGAYTNQSSAQFNQSAKVESQINSIKDTPSYAETGSNNIIVMPINSQSQNTPPSGRVNRAGGIAGNLGSGDTDIFNNSLSKVISYSFYKI